ncbi:LexA family transcriptional regulator [Roseovarius sp. MMSF_3281]|uniref:LexA family protein n=1 Tax=Roseovarius sp. MMSF_3281 TaxID=3046694 RepID=UPI00273E90E9|nr:helix-turn-helix domain-containing protein [Roseovarius sp. MMSF_3281]
MTPQQRKAYDFIVAFYEKHDYSPSFTEIADGTGLMSKSSVHRLVGALQDQGLIVHTHGRARSITPVQFLPGHISAERAKEIADYINDVLREHYIGMRDEQSALMAMRSVPEMLGVRE